MRSYAHRDQGGRGLSCGPCGGILIAHQSFGPHVYRILMLKSDPMARRSRIGSSWLVYWGHAEPAAQIPKERYIGYVQPNRPELRSLTSKADWPALRSVGRSENRVDLEIDEPYATCPPRLVRFGFIEAAMTGAASQAASCVCVSTGRPRRSRRPRSRLRLRQECPQRASGPGPGD